MDSQGRRAAENIVLPQGSQSEPAAQATIYLSPAETPGQRSMQPKCKFEAQQHINVSMSTREKIETACVNIN